jgi:hypothetical protein
MNSWTHPMEVEDADLGKDTLRLWTSKKAIEFVLCTSLTGVEASQIFDEDGSPTGPWGEVAKFQTVEIIKFQCILLYERILQRWPYNKPEITRFLSNRVEMKV